MCGGRLYCCLGAAAHGARRNAAAKPRLRGARGYRGCQRAVVDAWLQGHAQAIARDDVPPGVPDPGIPRHDRPQMVWLEIIDQEAVRTRGCGLVAATPAFRPQGQEQLLSQRLPSGDDEGRVCQVDDRAGQGCQPR